MLFSDFEIGQKSMDDVTRCATSSDLEGRGVLVKQKTQSITHSVKAGDSSWCYHLGVQDSGNITFLKKERKREREVNGGASALQS